MGRASAGIPGARVISALALALTLGCSGGSASSRPPVPFDQLQSQLIAIICHKTFTCCDATELASWAAFTDEASCRTHFAATLTSSAPEQALVSSGVAVYHGDRARRCLDAVEAQPCGEWGADLSISRYPDCAGIVEGTVAAGAACATSAECASGLCANAASGGAACAPVVALGESCASAACAEGLACLFDPSGGPRTCGHPRADGSACLFDNECISTLCVVQGNVGACGRPTMCNGV